MDGTTRDELDRLIEDITVDCYNEDEQLTGFLTAIEDKLTSPLAAMVVGTPVEVLAIAHDAKAGGPLLLNDGAIGRRVRGRARRYGPARACTKTKRHRRR
ncbi:MAG: hypothetical protein ACRDLA_06765 [Thermoleophilaceae bacterium]